MLTLERLRELAGETEWAAGKRIAEAGKIHGARRGPDTAEYLMTEPPYHTVTLGAPDTRACSCGGLFCRHLAAAAMKAAEDGVMAELLRRQEELSSAALFEAVEGALPEGVPLRLEPSVFLREGETRVSLRVGTERLYVVRQLQRFLKAVRTGERVDFGKEFYYNPDWMHFDEAQGRLLSVLDEYCDSLERAGVRCTPAEARRVTLPPVTAKRFFGALHELPFRLTVNGRTVLQRGIREEEVPALLYVEGTQQALKLSARLPEDCFPASPDGSFLYLEGRLARAAGGKRALAHAVLRFRTGDTAVFTFRGRDIPRFTSELLPSLMRSCSVMIDPALERRMIRLPLKAKVYLDKTGADIEARTVFVYGKHEIDPFSIGEDPPAFLLRDAQGERRVLEILSSAGFRVHRRRVYLSGDEEIHRFTTDGVDSLSRVAELFLSRDFRRLAPRTPDFSGRLTVKGGRLRLEMYDGGTPVEEFLPLMRALSEGRRYFRYKDGSFLNLDGLAGWQKLAGPVCEAAEEGGGERDLELFRAAYLSALIQESGLPVSADRDVARAFPQDAEEAVSPVDGLYPYQIRGFRWLYALLSMRMGGILADCRDGEAGKPSLIVAPTSLMYNWLSEIERFAPGLRVELVAGNRESRERQINAFSGDGAPDVMITSYPLVRQDIGLLETIPFRYAVLDEAQNVKNSDSIGARSVKRLRAESRVALTGTPLENNIGELWSLFDFVLPGYLPPLREFIRRYDEGRSAGDLLMRIRPFMMRRLKRDVMSELPGKLETTMYAGMTVEQRRVYDASLIRARERVEGLLSSRGLALGRIEVLAAITELRQICCHPALCLSQFSGRSGKMELLMDLLPPAIAQGHRVLLFSQFTAMLRLIRRRLGAEGIETLYLDGETPAADRLELTERFNAGEAAVFLASLKAGGTGLNLTGADMVIHYDPWWNPAAEEQAVDRAHRLGQERVVQVLRLVTRRSIEEQVVAMGQGKRRLFDRLVTPGEALPGRLGSREILALFGKGPSLPGG